MLGMFNKNDKEMKTTKILGLLINGKLMTFPNNGQEITPLKIARTILLVRMREEDKDCLFTSETRIQYYKEYCECLTENSDGETTYTIENSIDYVSDLIMYSNAPNIIGVNRVQVSSEYTEVVYKELVNLLETDLQKVLAD